MTHYVFSGSRVFNETAYSLRPGDDLYILPGAVITGQASTTLIVATLIVASGAYIDNSGTIASDYMAIQIGTGSVLSNHGTISINPFYPFASIVRVEGDGSNSWNYILNDGKMIV